MIHTIKGGNMNKEDINALDELNKGACMGKDSINFIIQKVKDKKLKNTLLNQYKEYDTVINKISKIYPTDKKEPHETNIMTKAMTWYGIEMKTLTDDSSSKIAELFLQGTNMGIIEGRKLLNNKDISVKVHKLIEKYVDMQESAVEKLKEFL